MSPTQCVFVGSDLDQISRKGDSGSASYKRDQGWESTRQEDNVNLSLRCEIAKWASADFLGAQPVHYRAPMADTTFTHHPYSSQTFVPIPFTLPTTFSALMVVVLKIVCSEVALFHGAAPPALTLSLSIPWIFHASSPQVPC